jgi:hypothetical protein
LSCRGHGTTSLPVGTGRAFGPSFFVLKPQAEDRVKGKGGGDR